MKRKISFLMIALLMSLSMASAGWATDGDFAHASYEASPDGWTGLVLNPEGKGDVLLFPYYDVRTLDGKSQETLFLIINETTDSWADKGMAAKIRFREWDKSEEVFDAEIWLSEGDVWVGVLRLDAATNLCNIWSPDWVIINYTSSQFQVAKALDNSGAGFNFLTDRITFTLPSGWTKEQMTQLGYFEVIGEERTASKVTSTDKVNRLTTNRGAPNTLMGSAYILRVSDGVAMGYNATALANFYLGFSLFDYPGSLIPDLSNADDGLDQVNFSLSKEDLFAPYSNETAIAGKASLIITFPTKHFFYDPLRNRIAGSNNPFEATKENDGEEINLTVWDRNENFTTPSQWWSPPRRLKLPYEVNICGLIKGTSISISPSPTSRDNVAFPTGTFETGYVQVGFDTIAYPVNTPDPWFNYFGNQYPFYAGYPTLALILQEFSNGAVGGYYGELNEAFYEVDWFATTPPYGSSSD